MTLNIDLEEVPFAILEAVKARIMASRRRLTQQQPRRSLRPRPQFAKIGANSKTWKLPKSPAMASLDASGYLLGPLVPAYINGGLPVKSSILSNILFSKHNLLYDAGSGYYSARDFGIANGPVAGTYALAKLSEDPEPSINYWFASNFAPSVGVDLASIMDLSGTPFFDPIARGTPYVEIEPLIDPAPLNYLGAQAGLRNSHTYEFIIKIKPYPVSILFNGFAFQFNPFVPEGGNIFQIQRLTGIDAVSTNKGDLDPISKEYSVYMTTAPLPVGVPSGFLQIDPVSDGQWVHVALSKSNNDIGFYVNGKRIFQANAIEDYWNLYAGFDAFSGSRQEFSVINGQAPLMCMVSIPNGTPSTAPAVHGIRYTPRALYTGAQFTPPTSITRLA